MGRLVAHSAVSEGARIVVADTDSDGIGALIGSLGHNYVDGIVCDFCDAAQVADVLALAVRRFGRFDAALNATYDSGQGAAVMEGSMTLCMQHEAECLITQGRGGSITNFHAADLASGVIPEWGPVALSGTDAVMKSAATVFRPRNIRINTVGCANLAGALTAARIAMYLASDAAVGITGEVFDAGDAAAIRRHPRMAAYLEEIRS